MSLSSFLSTIRKLFSRKTKKAFNEPIELIEGELLKFRQPDLPLVHKFAPGVYLREIFMPAGMLVIGHEHKTEHFNIILTGRARVMMNGETHLIEAPCTFVSTPGTRKVLHILEDMRWATVHVTNETDIKKIEEQMVVKSKAFVNKKQIFDDFSAIKVEENELPKITSLSEACR